MQTSMMGFVIIYKKENATATETNPTNVAYAAGQASQKEIVTATETYSTRVAYVVDQVFQMENVIVTETYSMIVAYVMETTHVPLVYKLKDIVSVI